MQERALQLLGYAFAGYGITLEEAIEKIKSTKEGILTEDQIHERKMLMDIIDNLIEFSVLEEYQMLRELESEADELDDYEEFYEVASETSKEYNSKFASIENADAWYSMGVALAWGSMESNAIVTYYTQGDERVRDSHRAFEGVSYLKSEYPAELIPPIDWACRCYIVESFDNKLLGGNPDDIDEKISKAVNPIFKKPYHDGAIFGSSHPYYDVYEMHLGEINSAIANIKKRILG